MNRFANTKPGDYVCCAEGGDYSIYLFMAVCGDYVIVATEYAHHEGDFEAQLEEMSEESINNLGSEVMIFPEKQVFLTESEALKYLKEYVDEGE